MFLIYSNFETNWNVLINDIPNILNFLPITLKKSKPYNLYHILPFNLNQRYYDAICVWIRVLSLYLISHKNLLLANYNKLDDDDATGICTHFNKLLHSHGESKFHRIITEMLLEKDLRFKKSFQTTINNWNKNI